MAHEDLIEAAATLREAAEAADDAGIADRLRDQADEMEALAERDPDHGRMARHENKLHGIADEGGDEVAEGVEAALGQIRAYRETVEGV